MGKIISYRIPLTAVLKSGRDNLSPLHLNPQLSTDCPVEPCVLVGPRRKWVRDTATTTTKGCKGTNLHLSLSSHHTASLLLEATCMSRSCQNVTARLYSH